MEIENVQQQAAGLRGKDASKADKPKIVEVVAEETASSSFSFVEADGDGTLSVLGGLGKEQQTLLEQWGVAQALQVRSFRASGDVSANPGAALADFFTGMLGRNVTAVDFEALETSTTDMSFFSRLSAPDSRVVSESGYLRKCMDEVFDGATSCSLVTDMLLNEDSEHADVFTESEKRELIYSLFKWVLVGGPLCQPSENVGPYLDVVKSLYKSVVKVVKSASAQKDVTVASKAYAVSALDGSNDGLFPKDNANNMCLVVFHPAQRSLTYLHCAFTPFM